MYIADGVDHGTRANMLVRQLIDEHDPKYGVGSMTCSIYDTAWVSMIKRSTGDDTAKWLFPWSFHYLIGHQQHDGGWHSSTADVDGILSTLAALLALCKHIATPYQLIYIPQEELKHKKDRAIYYLEAKFFSWDVAATEQKGFEILVPKLLQLLEQEGIEFSFPGRALLMDLKAKASAKYNPSLIYSNSRTILTQALEGFVGELDFDRVSQHKISGSMMASPASTAAYLMHCSTWDDEAEGYLRHVVSTGTEHAAGGVPSRYPTTVFEITTALSLLLENGFTRETLGERHLQSATSFLQDCLAIESGVTGFAPYVESDADNTARAISTLCHLGKPASPSGLLIRYETREYFKTYTQDRTPSFRTNCLVLKALLDLIPGNRDQVMQIQKCVKFITNCWWTTNGQVEDTWNVSSNYATMLMADALTRLVDLWEKGLVPILDDLVIRDKVFVCLFQALTRTMQTQNPDGSWGHSSQRCETTSYAILTLAKLSSFSSAPRIKLQLGQALENGRKFVRKNFRPSSEPDHVWNSKTTCGSTILFQAHVMAALDAPTRLPQPGHSLENRFEVPVAKIAIQTKYYSRQPWFANIAEWQIQAFLVESYLFLPQLKDVRFAVFQKEDLSEDRFFDSIPFAWIAASTVDQRFIGAEYLYQLMILTFLNRQFEDYVRNVIGQKFTGSLLEIEEAIQGIYDELEKHNSKDECHCAEQDSLSSNGNVASLGIRSTLYRYITHVLNHPYVLVASKHDQEQLHSELLFFLLSRVGQQISDDEQETSAIEAEALSRTTGNTASDQTSHQFTFVFLSCLVGNQTLNGTMALRRDFLETPEQQYLVADICRRLSILSFLATRAAEDDAPKAPYREAAPAQSKPRRTSFSGSDAGSDHSAVSSATIASSQYSDSDSTSPISPVSSVSSAPSRSPAREMFLKQNQALSTTSRNPPQQHTQQVARLLTHERKCLNICLESLTDAGTAKRTINVLRLFVDVSELSEQIIHDPNVGSYQANIAHQVIQRASIMEDNSKQPGGVEAPPVPPRRTDRRSEVRGSVAAARAALEIAPLQPKRDSVIPQVPSISSAALSAASMSRTQSSGSHSRSQSSERTSFDRNRFSKLSFSTANETLCVPSQDDININQSATVLPELTKSKSKHRRASRSSIEISRIERIMADIDGGNPRNSTLPIHPAFRRQTTEVLQPTANTIFPTHPTIGRGNTVAGRNRSRTMDNNVAPPRTHIVLEDVTNARSFPQRKPTIKLDKQARTTSSGVTPEDAETVKQARKRMATLAHTESKMKARARDAAIDRERKRASCLQARAMAEAALVGHTPPMRASTLKATSSKVSLLGYSSSSSAKTSMSSSRTNLSGGKSVATTSTAASSAGDVPMMSVDVAVANKGMSASKSRIELDKTPNANANANAGWVKSPPPQSNIDNADGAGVVIAGLAEIKEQNTSPGKLRRDSKWGGPKWKAPF